MNPPLPDIPGKRYFTIGEVSELCAVRPSVLRYWEQEFSQLKPVKRRGRRYFQPHEVELVRLIRELLYDRGFTIVGARNQLIGWTAHRAATEPEGDAHLLTTSLTAGPAFAPPGRADQATAPDHALAEVHVHSGRQPLARLHAATHAPAAHAATGRLASRALTSASWVHRSEEPAALRPQPEPVAGEPQALVDHLRLELLALRDLLEP